MGKGRAGTFVILAGGVGLLVGRVLLAKFPSSDTFDPDAPIPPDWTGDSDLLVTLVTTGVLIAVAVWHLRRFGMGKLAIVGAMAALALLTSLFDVGDGEPVWSSDAYAGDELVGIWLCVASALAVLAGVAWSAIRERPPGTKTFWGYLFAGGLGGSSEAAPAPGVDLSTGSRPVLPELWRWGRWIVVAVAAYLALTFAQYLFVGDEASSRVDTDDMGPVQEEQWTIVRDGGGPGVHTISLIESFGPLAADDVREVGGRLVWPETEVELCGVGLRAEGDGFVQVGDILLTNQGCGDDDSLPVAVEERGLPVSACLFVRSDDVDEYCADLEVVGASDS